MLTVIAQASKKNSLQTLKNPGQKIVILGDSNVRRIIFYSNWAAEVNATDDTTFISLGYDGYETTNIINTGAPTPLAATLAEDPDIVYLSIGGNDVFDGVDPVVTMANIKIICDTLIAAGIKVVVTTMLCQIKSRNDTYKNAEVDPRNFNQWFLTANGMLLTLCKENQYDLMDTRPYVCTRDEDNIWDLEEQFSSDGIHLSLDGYKQWAIALTKNMNEHN